MKLLTDRSTSGSFLGVGNEVWNESRQRLGNLIRRNRSFRESNDVMIRMLISAGKDKEFRA